MLKSMHTLLKSISCIELKAFLADHVVLLPLAELVKFSLSLRCLCDTRGVSTQMLRLVVGDAQLPCNSFELHKPG